MRKGQGLPLNVIILAVLGIVVLVVLVFIFSDKAGSLNEAGMCENNRGDCIDKTSCPDDQVRSFLKCEKTASGDKQICCQKIRS